MKLVIGIVRPERANDVLEALFRAEVRGLSISRVQGHGGDPICALKPEVAPVFGRLRRPAKRAHGGHTSLP